MSEQGKSCATERAVVTRLPGKDLRRNPRAKISKPVRVRPSDPRYQEEVQTTLNASRDGVYFTTGAEHYYTGMYVRVVFPYALNDLCNMELLGEVVRIERLPDGRRGIAVRILLR